MFSTEGLHFEGLLRGLQGDLMLWAGFIVIAVTALLLARRSITASQRDGILNTSDAHSWRRNVTRLFAIACALSVLALGWRVATVAAINRMPRADAGKTQVYEQMKKNAEPAKKQ
jgi:hypothetical protein